MEIAIIIWAVVSTIGFLFFAIKALRSPENTVDLQSKLDLIISNQNLTTQKLNDMANEIEDLTTEVSETKGIMLSAKTTIEGFAAALAKAGTDPVKLKALKDDLNAGSEELAAAITANPLPGEVVVPTPE